ncbi:hypothetical protein [Fodinibius sp.]|uniref:hypothetical protein n=1 Tax=Fodinibius sp. TaxID=1872440 RepID=UPI002ACD4805|nr:hypothetical protein [Fodinibius sp.]MDZ7658030.1 hypothetical protein [Fodinibius sp.]
MNGLTLFVIEMLVYTMLVLGIGIQIGIRHNKKGPIPSNRNQAKSPLSTRLNDKTN